MTLAALILLPIIILGTGGAAPDPPEAPACATQTQDIEVTSYTGYSTHYTSEERGQEFKPTISGQLYSVSWETNAATTTTLTMRIGASKDLSGVNNMAEWTCAVSTAGADWEECVIPEASRPTLASGTTYYVIVRTSANWDQRKTGDTYSDGGPMWDTVLNWVGVRSGTSDRTFRTKMCD